ncbi:MAG: sigma-54 dependent transcriptional regulator [Hyphomonadaceae bacterium]
MAKTVLVVDDDPTQRRLLQAAAEKQGFRARVVDSGDKALEEASDPRNGVDVVMLDLVMPGLSGMETLERLMERRPDLPVIVLTASGGIDTVVQAMRAGAIDFFVKPASPERIAISIRNALKMSDLKGEVKRLARKSGGSMGFDDMIAGAPAMKQVVRLGQRAAASNIPILILGESGVGKEVLARCIQGASERSGKPFISVNCGAIPENLVESILFGHEKGSFTGAVDKKLGKFVEADQGTLFLDEVGELPLDIQVKLLRVLQEGEVDAVGARRPTKVDVRIISATNRDLAQLVQEGRFREDLYYRLNVFPIEAPPLRQRKEDLPSLIDHFISRFNAEEGKAVPGVAPDTMTMLQTYDWPGNVRQLENSIFRAIVLSEGGELKRDDFPQIASLMPESVKPVEAPPTAEPSDEQPADPVAPDSSGAETPVAANDQPVLITDPRGELRTLEEIERDLIQFAIDHYSGHMSEVARKLGIGRSTLYRKVREYDLKVRDDLEKAD